MRMGTINPASLPSFLEVDDRGNGEHLGIGSQPGAPMHGVIPTSRHTRKTAMPRRIVMSDRLEDVTGI